jgi:hypothetical protein
MFDAAIDADAEAAPAADAPAAALPAENATGPPADAGLASAINTAIVTSFFMLDLSTLLTGED